jgi:hypothetical protein
MEFSMNLSKFGEIYFAKFSFYFYGVRQAFKPSAK